MRVVVLACAYLTLVAVAVMAVLFSAYSSVSEPSSGGTGPATMVHIAGATLYQTNRLVVIVILTLMAVALAVATFSFVWRVRHNSTSRGTSGLVAALMVSLVAFVGILTIGPFLFPLAALLMVLALPMQNLTR